MLARSSSRSLAGSLGITWRAQQVAERGYDRRGSGLPDHDEIEPRVIQLLEQVLGGTVRRELDPQPRETVAGPRAGVGQARQRLREWAPAVLDTGLGNRAKHELSYPVEPHRESHDLRQDPRPEHPGQPAIGYDDREPPVGRREQLPRDRDALVLVGVEYRRVRSRRQDERQLPAQVVCVLKAGVHALRADRAVYVRRVAQQEATAVAKAHGAAMMDAVRGEPAASLKGQAGSRFLAHRGNHVVKFQVVSSRARPAARSPRSASDRSRASGKTGGIRRATDTR